MPLGRYMVRLARLCLLVAWPLLAGAVAPDQPRWFNPPPPHPGALSKPDLTHRLSMSGIGVESVTVIGRRSPIQHDPYERAPVEPLRTYQAGASWGSTHPGEFCCASQYETGLDGQAGR